MYNTFLISKFETNTKDTSMKRLLLLLILLTTTASAGFYGGLEWRYTSLDGTYEATYSEPHINDSVTKQYDISKSLNSFGINLGYGYANTMSGNIYINAGIGTNFSYAFEPLSHDLYPHILVGMGFLAFEDLDISGTPNYLDKSQFGAQTLFTQVGAGLSYVVNDTVELYGDLLLMLHMYSDVYQLGSDVDYEKQDGSIDNVSIGFEVGVRFHAFGKSKWSLSAQELELREKALQRDNEIDAFID